jgi:2-polyprenyl-3-methyl-5-hydroxy-6-metoxy-1,4-benzoquinol methylase
MHKEINTEFIPCPLCNDKEYGLWGTDNGFSAVKCKNCGLVYVNPRPVSSKIDEAVRSGVHSDEANQINVITRRIDSKVDRYSQLFNEIFQDVWQQKSPVSWLDVGAGFGEVVEAVMQLAPLGSNVQGIEPMQPKAQQAQSRGLNIQSKYLKDVTERFQYLSLINVFSHIPNFDEFLDDAKKVLTADGEILIETGNAADFDRNQTPGELSLPDHLIFAGENNMRQFLQNAGFEIVSIKKIRTDTLLPFIKNVAKRMLGRNINLALPYTSPYRTMLIRAKIRGNFTSQH